MDFLTSKCSKLVNIIKYLGSTWWGGHAQILCNIYKAIIRGVFDYTSIFNFCDKKKGN